MSRFLNWLFKNDTETDIVMQPVEDESKSNVDESSPIPVQDAAKMQKHLDYRTYLEEVQKEISLKYSSALYDESKKHMLYDYIDKFIQDYKYIVDGVDADELSEKLYRDMAEYSILTKWLDDKRTDIEEININAWNDITVNFDNGDVIKFKETFYSETHAVDVIKRLLQQSGMVLDMSKPIVRGFLGTNKRITVVASPVVDKNVGISASIRVVNPKKMKKDDFKAKKTATAEMLDFLALALQYNISQCISGETNTGKTTLMSWILSEIDNHKRIVTIEEDVREFDLIKYDENGNIINNVVHMVTRHSDNEKEVISSEKELETALTMNPDVICVAEMKSTEAFAAQEAARTGHAVIATTHANSAEATYARICTLCITKYPIDYKILNNLVREAFPIIFYVKRLEDNSRRIMKINECIVHEDGSNEIKTLWQFKTISNDYDTDGKCTVNGYFEKVNSISPQLQKRFIENGMPKSVLDKLIGQEGA